VMGQTAQPWKFRDIYRGFPFQVLRTTALVTPIFTMVDSFRQKTDYMKSLTGNFMVVAGCSGLAYMICWPLVRILLKQYGLLGDYDGAVYE
jgi:hypothetical protein